MESGKDDSTSEQFVEELRDEIDSVLKNRERVVEAGKNLLGLWTIKEVRTAIAIASPEERETPDPRVAEIIEEHVPKLLAPSYKVGLTTNLDKAMAAAEAGETEAAHGFLDLVIEEARDLRDSGRVSGDFEEMISRALAAKKSLDEEAAEKPQ